MQIRGCIQKFPDWPPGGELQMVQLSATRCSCIAILWASLLILSAITLCVASQRVFIAAVVYFIIDSVRELLDTPSYFTKWTHNGEVLRVSDSKDVKRNSFPFYCIFQCVTWNGSNKDVT